MKKTKSYGLAVAFLALCAIGCKPAPRQADTTAHLSSEAQTPAAAVPLPDSSAVAEEPLQIIFPKGGDTLTKGKTYRFTWTGGADSILAIFLVDSSLESKGASVSLTDRRYGIPNKGAYDYRFPSRVTAGTYMVRIGGKASGYFQVVTADTASGK